MSTLVSLLLAAVFNFLGNEIPNEVKVVSPSENFRKEISKCEEQSNLLASNYIIIKNEQLITVKGSR